MRIKNYKIKFMNIALINTIKNTKAINNAFSSSSNNLTNNSTRFELDIGDDWLYNHKDLILDILLNGISFPKKDTGRLNTAVDENVITTCSNGFDVALRDIGQCYQKISQENAFSHYKSPFTSNNNVSGNSISNAHLTDLSKFIFLDYQNLLLTNGKKIVTLITCTNDSKQRVVVKAEAI